MANRPGDKGRRTWMRPFPVRKERTAALTVDLSYATDDPPGTSLIRFAAPHDDDLIFVAKNYRAFCERFPLVAGVPGAVAGCLLLASRYVPDAGEVLSVSDRLDHFGKLTTDYTPVTIRLLDEMNLAFGPPI